MLGYRMVGNMSELKECSKCGKMCEEWAPIHNRIAGIQITDAERLVIQEKEKLCSNCLFDKIDIMIDDEKEDYMVKIREIIESPKIGRHFCAHPGCTEKLYGRAISVGIEYCPMHRSDERVEVGRPKKSVVAIEKMIGPIAPVSIPEPSRISIEEEGVQFAAEPKKIGRPRKYPEGSVRVWKGPERGKRIPTNKAQEEGIMPAQVPQRAHKVHIEKEEKEEEEAVKTSEPEPEHIKILPVNQAIELLRETFGNCKLTIRDTDFAVEFEDVKVK